MQEQFSEWDGKSFIGCFEPSSMVTFEDNGNAVIRTTAAEPQLIARPGVLHPTGKYMIIDLAAEGGVTAELFLHGVWWERTGRRIELIADWKFHRYNLDLGNVSPEDPEVYVTSFLPTDQPGAEVRIGKVFFSDIPCGDPAVTIHYAGMVEAFNRIGQGPRKFIINCFNPGGGRADSLEIAELKLPAGIHLVETDNWNKLPPLGPVDCCNHTIELVAETPAAGEFTLRLKGENAPVEPYRGRIEFLPSLNLAPETYPAEPKKISTGPYELGALYFPGWTSIGRWNSVRETAPERRPVLGYYNEGNPEIVDWQIKWLAENGISFLLVDWYWSAGYHFLSRWLEGYEKCRYKSYLKWAVMWANHNPPDTHSVEDQIKVTKFWIDNYFGTPGYYKIDGKPVVMVWMWENMDRDLGPGGAKKLLELSRQMAREAGYPGIYFIDMKWPEGGTSPEIISRIKEIGFDCTSIYHYMESGGRHVNQYHFPFDDVAATNKEHWEQLHKTGILPFLPNLSTGWDDRPWHGCAGCSIPGRTVEHFRKICADAKEFSDRTGVRRLLVAPLNEWGEGSYAEPNTEFGFGMYETLRETFGEKPAEGWPLNYTPEDVKFDIETFKIPFDNTRESWDFLTGHQGWHGKPVTEAADGKLKLAFPTGKDAIGIELNMFHPSDYSALVLEFNIGTPVDEKGSVELWWGSPVSCNRRRGSGKVALPLQAGNHRIELGTTTHPDAPGRATSMGLAFELPAGTELAISRIELIRR